MLRQSLSKIINLLQSTGEPIMLERGRKPAAVIISLEDFKKRFVEKEADEQRKLVVEKIKKMARKSKTKETSEQILHKLRYGF